MHFESKLRGAAAAAAAFLFGAGAALAASPNGVPFGSDVPGSRKLPNGATLIPSVHHDISLPLSAIPPIPPGPPDDVDRSPGRIPIDLPAGRPDPVHQKTMTALAMPTSSSFEGMGAGLSGFSPGGTPPDTNGDIGPNHYIETVNTSVTVFSRSGAILLGPENISTLWSGFGGGCQTNNDGDPVVKYDVAADRWVVSQFSVSSTPYLQCVAVSATNDPTGSWNRYSFSFGTSNFNDYPKIGVWPDAYYFSFNIFANGSTFSGGMACAYDRADMISGAAAKAAQCFGPKANDGGMLPSDVTGTTLPPAGSPDYYVDLQTSSLNLWRFHVDWTTPSNSTFTGPTSLAVASYSALCSGGTCVPQPGTTQKLDSLADRLMYRLGYRNMGSYESLVVNHSVTAGSGGGVRWYEIRSPGGTPSIFQQGTFAPDSSYRWMGSVAMDHVGNIAAGYSISDGSSVKPGIRFAGRLVTDPAGQFSQGESTMIAGGGVNTGSYSRWGDYSSLSVDPVDDCTFWYANEYYASNGDSFHWQTRIGSFKYSSCSTTSSPDFSISAAPTSVSVVQGNNGTSTISTSALNGFNNAIALSASGQPSGVTVSFNPTSIAAPGSGSSTMTMAVGASTATGTYAITVTGTGGGTTHTATVSLTVTSAPVPDFSISASPTSVSVVQGNNGTSTISTSALNGFNSAIALSASGQPSGVTVSFNPTSIAAPGSGSSTMTMAVGASTATGTYAITVTGTGGGVTHTANVSLTVTAAGSNMASYDATLRAPKCAVVGSSCDSGPSLLLGRATLGPEPNYSNTINGSCADGTSGTFHSDESNDALKIFTTDGSNFAAGKTVTVQATVWAYSGYTSDHLDLYYTANASSPAWTLIGTINPTKAGSQVLSANYTLPSGALQAVRANFRYTGSASSCTAGSYNDHDDLIFAVTSTPDFSISASPSSLSVVQGSNGTSTITTAVSGGFNNAVSLSASGQPSGVTVSFNPASIAAPGSGSSTATFTVASSVATGTYPITITGSGGGTTHTTSVSLTVTASGGSTTLFTDGFESAGWSTAQVSGTGGAWTLVTSSSHPSISAHGGTHWADFNSYTSASGNQTRLYKATGFAVPTSYTTVTLTFWMYHDTGYSTYPDKVQAQVSTNGGSSWSNAGSAVSRYDGSTGWKKVTIDLSSYKGQTINLGFLGISGFGNDEYLDDVLVTAQ